MNKRAQQAFDHDVRIQAVVDFASMWNSLQDLSRIPDQLEEVIEDSFDNKHLHPSMRAFIAALDIADEEEDESLLTKLQELPSTMTGLIFMQGATPVRDYHSPTGWSSGWGRYYTGWVAAETFTAAWNLLCKWADEMHKRDLAAISGQKPG